MMLRLFGAFALFAALATPSALAQPPDRAALEKRLAELLRERVEELRRELPAREGEYKAGRGWLDVFLESLHNLDQAELELSDDPKQRVAAHEQLVESLRVAEMIAKDRFNAGRLSIRDYMQVQANRALAECALVQEQMQIAGADKDKLTARLTQLRRERLTALQSEVDARTKEHKSGREVLDILLEAQKNLAQAEIDLASTPHEQQKAREQLVRAAKELEKEFEARFKDGRTPIQDMLQVRAVRIEAEIALGDRVAQLRQELVTTWKQIVAALEKEYRAGRGLLDRSVEAQIGLA
ncbi:MAG: hypothetical protein ACRD9W_12815, partial [Terriglobia bacterium]